MREQLLSLVSQFNRGELSARVLQDGLEELNKKGVWQHLSPDERELFNRFFSWCAGMYDPSRPPRPGLIGKLKDGVAQFKGEYRVSLEQLKEGALEVERELRAGH